MGGDPGMGDGPRWAGDPGMGDGPRWAADPGMGDGPPMGEILEWEMVPHGWRSWNGRWSPMGGDPGMGDGPPMENGISVPMLDAGPEWEWLQGKVPHIHGEGPKPGFPRPQGDMNSQEPRGE